MGFLPKQITNYEEFDFIQVMAIENFFLPEMLYNVFYKEETHVDIPLFSINRHNCCSTQILRTKKAGFGGSCRLLQQEGF